MKLNTDIFKKSPSEFVKELEPSKVIGELRSNKLFPLAIVLLVAIVAVPIALSKSASNKQQAVTQAQATPPPATGVPALNVQSTSASTTSRLPGRGRNPFQQTGGGASKGTTGAQGSTGSSSSSSNGTSGSSKGSSGGGSTGSAKPTSSSTTTTPGASTPVTPPNITPSKKPTPAPSGLSSNQSYQVELAMTNPSGGINTIDSLQRLSVLPSAKQPWLVELGVLKGGNRVLFAVQPKTLWSGPGVCTPGPADCEILSLAPGQTENLGVQTPSGDYWTTLFAITRITAQKFPSAGAADRARKSESAAGRAILNRSTSGSLSLFRYSPSVGAVLDLRSLTVGAG